MKKRQQLIKHWTYFFILWIKKMFEFYSHKSAFIYDLLRTFEKMYTIDCCLSWFENAEEKTKQNCVFVICVERSEICQGDGMGRYHFRTGGTSPRILMGRCTSSIIIHGKPPGSIPETGEHFSLKKQFIFRQFSSFKISSSVV